MLPQNGHQHRPQNQQGLPSFMPSNPSNHDPSSSFFALDPSMAAKQMAALNAANQLRMATSRSAAPSAGGTSSGPYLGGITSVNPPAGGTAESSPFAMTANFQIPNSGNLPHNPNASSSFLDPSMSQPNPARTLPVKQRQRNFLNGLASLMISRNTPLPPALTGVPYPSGYDPTNSPWKIIEPSTTEQGAFRLAGKDVDLFKLWGVVLQAGGGNKLNSMNGWHMILPHFDLPEQLPQAQPNGLTSVAMIISQYYNAILLPFEDAYKKNMQDQQRRVQASRQVGAQQPATPAGQGRQAPINGAPASFPGHLQGGSSAASMAALMSQSSPHAPHGGLQFPQSHTPHQTPPTSATNPHMPQFNSSIPHSSPAQPLADTLLGSVLQLNNGDRNVLDEGQGIKRKLEEDVDTKRVRQRTDTADSMVVMPPSSIDRSTVSSVSPSTVGASSGNTQVSNSVPPSARSQPTRRKIEYVPFAREVDTFGGRDLKYIEAEMSNLPQRRPLRDINDWGNVDIEALTMSIRSRLATELSYALTTFTLLSTMRGQTPGSGFPIFQCPDLLDEALDLVEEKAFDSAEDKEEDACHLATHRELVNIIYDVESQPFASLQRRQGSKNPDIGPLQRPGNLVLTVMNIIRNLSTIQDNQEFLARHERLVDVILRLCRVTRSKDNATPHPSSPILSLGDLVVIRKDTLYTFANISGLLHFASSDTPHNYRIANRTFQLVASYLVDPVEAVSPIACLHLAGIPTRGQPKPPSLADTALDVFTRFSQSDTNRRVLSQIIPQESIWELFGSLVHRLPIVEADFHLVNQEHWLSYLEKTIMGIYSLAFLAPPDLKQRFKADRSLGFTKVMLRMIQKFLTNPSPELRGWFTVSARRAIEALKVVDDGENSFDAPKSTLPAMSFGMGYGEVGDNDREKGTGLLGGHRDVTWDMLMMRELDEVMFAELESLARVEASAD